MKDVNGVGDGAGAYVVRAVWVQGGGECRRQEVFRSGPAPLVHGGKVRGPPRLGAGPAVMSCAPPAATRGLLYIFVFVFVYLYIFYLLLVA